MITSRWPRWGLLLALLTLLALSFQAPGRALAQDAPAPSADTIPPLIVQPDNLVVAAVDGSGAAVTYAIPTANDETDGPVAVVCAPTPGSIFPLGGTLVTCSAYDAAGNQAAVTFTITVTDQTAPVITWPADIVVDAVDAAGVMVNYAVPAAQDTVNGAIAVGCDIPTGSLFPVGTTAVTCFAQDATGNAASPVTFHVTVNPPPPPPPPSPTPTATDTSPAAPEEATAPETETATATPEATATETETSTPEATETETASPTSETEPTATATASPSPESTATATATATSTPTPNSATGTPTPDATAVAISTPQATAASTPTNTLVTMAETATKIETASAIEVPTPKSTPTQTIPSIPVSIPTPTAPVDVPAALELPWPPPADFILVTDGGPIDGLSAIWNHQDFPISQEFGHTGFSIQHYSWYAYGTDYGLDGYEHPGIDIGMPAGTPLYSPVDGIVKVAGGVPFYTYYGNGQPGVGELLIETADGNEVILGHMGRITVQEGQPVEAGQFVGLSGGDNGDHVHLETRELQPSNGYRIVDPRQSFLIPALENAARQNDEATPPADEPADRRTA